MTDIQRLRILRAVAEHGSFNRAAAHLLITPSAVSQQVAALERSLGTRVVERSTRGVTLTQSGRIMVEAADAVTAELAHAREQVERLTRRRPVLTVTTFTSGGRELLPGALARFRLAHPEVELHVVEHEPEESLPLVRQARADLALAYHFDGPPAAAGGERSGLDWTPLMEDPMSLVVPRSHRLADRETVGFAELATETWVLGCSKTEAYLRRYARLAGYELRVRGSTTDYFFARSLVAAGMGISLVPSVALTPPLDGTRVVRVDDPRPTRYIGVATARLRRPSPHVTAFVTALREQAS